MFRSQRKVLARSQQEFQKESSLFVVADCCVELKPMMASPVQFIYSCHFLFKTNTNMLRQDGQEWVGEEQPVQQHSHMTFIDSFYLILYLLLLSNFSLPPFGHTNAHKYTRLRRHMLLCGSQVCVDVRSQAKQFLFLFALRKRFDSYQGPDANFKHCGTLLITHAHTRGHAHTHTRYSGFKQLSPKISPYCQCYGR